MPTSIKHLLGKLVWDQIWFKIREQTYFGTGTLRDNIWGKVGVSNNYFDLSRNPWVWDSCLTCVIDQIEEDFDG
jgi:hypothetical protein